MLKLVIFSFLFFTSCKNHKLIAEITLIEVDELAKEQQIPKQIMLELDSELQEEFKVTPPLYSFTPLTVEFSDQEQGVLKKPRLKLSFPKGGGDVNLRDIISGEGSFYMHFPADQFDQNKDLLHVFFISNSPKVKIENELFGLGCGKWIDIKPGFKNLQKDDYLKLNTNELRYLRVLAGTYVFVFKQGKNISLTQLSITDSNHKGELCVSGLKNES